MADIINRLLGNVDPDSADPQEQKIPAHQFYASVCAVADGVLTRAQFEALYNMSANDPDLTTLITGFQAAADKGRYLNAIHCIGLAEEAGYNINRATALSWLTNAQAAY